MAKIGTQEREHVLRCSFCDRMFSSHRSDAKTCSPKCRQQRSRNRRSTPKSEWKDPFAGLSCWGILGIDQRASPETIKSAYRKLMLQHHPDRGGDCRTTARIQEAYQQAIRAEAEDRAWRQRR